MSDKAGENEPLSAAREKIAHVRINTERAYGAKLDKLAGMATPQYNTPEFAPSLEATVNAVINDANGKDPTKGAVGYNMRKSMDEKGPFQGHDMSTQSGPYASPTVYNVVVTYVPEKQDDK
jgi:ABC-type transporter MlaC component